MELVVGMSLMSIFMGLFTAAVVGMFSATSKMQAVVNSSTQLNTAFDRLDTQVRYASSIDQPVPPGTSPNPVSYWSVTFFTAADPTTTSSSGATPATCTQIAAGTVNPINPIPFQLAERSWTVNADGSALAATGWSQLALGVTNVTPSVAGTIDQPFSVQTTAGSGQQQLKLRFIDQDTTSKTLTTSVSEITFSALNSGAAATAAAAQKVAGGSAAIACVAPTP